MVMGFRTGLYFIFNCLLVLENGLDKGRFLLVLIEVNIAKKCSL